MVTQPHDEQLSKAWELHRAGKYAEAITTFDEIVKLAPDHLDAVYGRGLSERTSGKFAAALASFEEAVRLARAALAVTPGIDRYEMLERMSEQRISELQQTQR